MMGLINNSMLMPYQDDVDWDHYKRSTYLLGHSPLRMAYVIGAYLIFIYKIGPILMYEREGHSLKSLLRVLNAINILINIVLFNWGLHITNNFSDFFNCKALDRNPDDLVYFMEAFIFSRLFDLSDTIVLVFRKKKNQITKLHVFHHTAVPVAMFVGAHFQMTPFLGFAFAVNILVHVIMYTYYTMASFPSLIKHLWWKRYLTGIQISQFVLILIYHGIGYYWFSNNCSQMVPQFPSILVVGGSSTFLVLFTLFYMKAYTKKIEKKND